MPKALPTWPSHPMWNGRLQWKIHALPVFSTSMQATCFGITAFHSTVRVEALLLQAKAGQKLEGGPWVPFTAHKQKHFAISNSSACLRFHQAQPGIFREILQHSGRAARFKLPLNPRHGPYSPRLFFEHPDLQASSTDSAICTDIRRWLTAEAQHHPLQC